MSTEVSRHALSGATMGTRWSAIFHPPASANTPDLNAALSEAVDRVDRQMSTWKPDSDLMRFNDSAPGMWLPLPCELMTVLAVGLDIGRASGGAFDVGLGNLVNAWGFGPQSNRPDLAAVRGALNTKNQPSYEVLELDRAGGRARKHAQVTLDLSGIAKGFGVDEMVRVLRAFGIESALVSLDGEVRAMGVKSDGAPWAIAVEEPSYEVRRPIGIVALHEAAIATSGDYRHWIDVGHKRLSHTMDRGRGGPVDNAVASVSVIAESCMEADAWATAISVAGPTDGVSLARSKNLSALLIMRTDAGFIQAGVGAAFTMGGGNGSSLSHFMLQGTSGALHGEVRRARQHDDAGGRRTA